MELLDVVDENNKLTGKVMSRDEIHKQRLRHREVAVWIMNQKGEILIQKKSSNQEKRS